MAGLLEKIRLVTLSAAHKLLDRAIDLNSTEAVRQYVRDLEDALSDLQDAAAVAHGHTRTVAREGERINAQATELNRNLDFILSDQDAENDRLALPLEARLAGIEQRIATNREEAETGERTARALDDAVAALKTKYEDMVGQLSRLEAVERSTKAKESAAKALKGVAGMTGEGAPVSVDDVSARLEARADVADARFERALDDMSGGVEKDLAMAQAAARLAARKARLAAPAAQGALPSGEATSAASEG